MKRDGGGRRSGSCRRFSRKAAREETGETARLPEEPEPGARKTLSSGYCRLCHGRFSSRSLRQAFGKVPVTGQSLEKQRRMDHVFFADFQQLLGVPVQQDPGLPQSVCKDCHTQFYKCRSVLRTFIQRVNISPMARSNNPLSGAPHPDSISSGPCADLITSSPDCLHSLVHWSHSHAGGCSSVPSLQQVLSTQYSGIIRAVWGCREGHDHIMELDSATSDAQDEEITTLVSSNGIDAAGTDAVTAAYSPPHSMQTTPPISDAGKEGNPPSHNRLPAPPPESPASPCPDLTDAPEAEDSAEQGKEDGSDLSEGESRSKDDGEEMEVLSSDDSFTPYTEKRIPPRKSSRRKAGRRVEPGERKKPGPKPDWRKKIKREREELPTIYKCPYQGCTAVYRGADGMKKHIKEHHEEMRERPCPHPGCNKVFMIDRYLQRHVKMIHTEERNYICDQCGQAFKQRKHLSVHQMRHSGAKPLQCEVCGFQCRQRASLKYHMTKHKAEADLEFACDQCGKRFEKAHNLNVHMSMVHPLTQSPAKPPDIEPDTPSGTAEGQAMKPELAQQLPS
ncbi:zinc finger protein 276 [Hyperolius riggenbachi]|uniref:zinc finger protein 276 n=1 Tax=Hyperolius riggenbachi TaxID=752182 RepID=UPI0035A2E781